MALMLAICKPQPNWIPKNPRFMFQTCAKRNRGFSMRCLAINRYRERRQSHVQGAVARLHGGRSAEAILQHGALRHSRSSQGKMQRDFLRRIVEYTTTPARGGTGAKPSTRSPDSP